MWHATQARDAYPYYQHTEIGYNYRMSNVCAGIGRGQMTVLDAHIAHHKHVQELYEELLADVPRIHLHKQPSEENENGVKKYDSNFWLCAATLDEDVKIQGQKNVYKEVIKTAVGGVSGVVKSVDSAVTASLMIMWRLLECLWQVKKSSVVRYGNQCINNPFMLMQLLIPMAFLKRSSRLVSACPQVLM